jgi:hypothetical protein
VRDDGFDGFDWAAWAEDEETATSAGANGRHDGVQDGRDERGSGSAPPGGASAAADEERAPAGWVSAGGVVRWEEPDEVSDDPRVEAESPLAADELDLPQGAPDAPRVRAVHAWIVRQRTAQHEAIGALLLQQRERHADEEAQDSPGRRRSRRGAHESSPLELAIAEHQATADEYDVLLETLDELAAHSGAGQVLVEFYLWLAEHLADLAAAPEAAAETPTNLAEAAWHGRAQAALGVRGRVERVTAPPPED